jgi:hypothetical protein
VWLRVTGIGVPCLFRLFTGLLCPGCGASRAVIALTQGQLLAALQCNGALIALLPVFAWLGLCAAHRYVHTGSARLARRQEAVALTVCTILVVFGIVRNLPALWFLRPPG